MKYILVMILAASIFHTYFAVKKLISGKGMVKVDSSDDLDKIAAFQAD